MTLWYNIDMTDNDNINIPENSETFPASNTDLPHTGTNDLSQYKTSVLNDVLSTYHISIKPSEESR